ncbi:hypothetical protein V1477_017132, partial [Vespula maculifrons]
MLIVQRIKRISMIMAVVCMECCNVNQVYSIAIILTKILQSFTDYYYDCALPVYNEFELLHFQLTSISTYLVFNFPRIILSQFGVTLRTSVLEPSQNFLS